MSNGGSEWNAVIGNIKKLDRYNVWLHAKLTESCNKSEDEKQVNAQSCRHNDALTVFFPTFDLLI